MIEVQAMKTVYFVRHAKSSWQDMSLPDHDRPLNKRGKRDAPYMAEQMLTMELRADLMLTSSARRARATARFFRKSQDLPKERLLVDKRLYHASIETVLQVIQELPDDLHVIYLFAHNPGLTYIANHFSTKMIDNVPTTGIIKVVSQSMQWINFDPNSAVMKAFYYPKMFNLR